MFVFCFRLRRDTVLSAGESELWRGGGGGRGGGGKGLY